MFFFDFKVRRRSLLSCFTLAMLGLLLSLGCIEHTQTPEEKTAGDLNGKLKVALGMFEVDCGRFSTPYPTTAEGLQLLLKIPKGSFVKNWRGPYLDGTSDLKDGWGHEYIYRCPGIHNPNGYDLYSVGPDGKDGTADDIGNWAVTGQN